MRRRAAAPTATGLSFDPLLPFEAWSAIGARIARHSSATTWWLGDWLIYGQDKYGRRYKEAIAATGLDYQTLRNYAMVARRFEVSRRRDGLTFHHHAEVCALSDADQDRWLDAPARRAGRATSCAAGCAGSGCSPPDRRVCCASRSAPSASRTASGRPGEGLLACGMDHLGALDDAARAHSDNDTE